MLFNLLGRGKSINAQPWIPSDYDFATSSQNPLGFSLIYIWSFSLSPLIKRQQEIVFFAPTSIFFSHAGYRGLFSPTSTFLSLPPPKGCCARHVPGASPRTQLVILLISLPRCVKWRPSPLPLFLSQGVTRFDLLLPASPAFPKGTH